MTDEVEDPKDAVWATPLGHGVAAPFPAYEHVEDEVELVAAPEIIRRRIPR